MLNRVGLALIAAFLMPACATYRVPPGTPATDVLRSAERADWRARIETRDTAREGVVTDLTSDSVTVGAARVAVADITSIHRRRDASQFILIGAATGVLAGMGAGFVITPWFGPFGYVILGASTGTGIVLGALAARRATEDDWYQVWPPADDRSPEALRRRANIICRAAIVAAPPGCDYGLGNGPMRSTSRFGS